MVRTVKAGAVRSLNKGEHAVLLPGATSAEIWKLWILGAQPPASVQVCATPLENRLRRKTTLVFPVSEVFCLPLWLNETDSKLFPEVISLQLELRGLQPKGNAVIFEWTTIAAEASRTLVMVAVLPPVQAEELQADAYDSFDLSARYYVFPENALTIWPEQDRFNVAITRGKELVHFQVLGEEISQRVVQDLNCIKATLAMQNIAPVVSRVVTWAGLRPADVEILQAGLRLPVHQEEMPGPRMPQSSWKLVPASVNDARQNRKLQKWRRWGIAAALAIYLLTIAVLGFKYSLLWHGVEAFKAWQTQHAQAISLVRETRATWKELGPVVNQDRYPLELLLHAAEAVPGDQLHLTLFEVNGDHVLIKGEAKNVTAAFQFFNKVKGDAHFSGCNWDMAQPRLLPNDLAQFQIEGTFATTN